MVAIARSEDCGIEAEDVERLRQDWPSERDVPRVDHVDASVDYTSVSGKLCLRRALRCDCRLYGYTKVSVLL